MNKVDYEMEGVLFNIQRYSLHDGPGIRTIPFFKGCPLSCKWCSNPESQRPQPELIFKKSDCIRCGKCIEVCKQQALSISNAFFIDRERCIQCGECTQVCPTQALEMKGKRMTVADVMRELQKEENLYRRSGGGITLSGGEPLAQPAFARELLKACKEKGWHTAMETTGFTTPEVIADVFPYVDLALTDIKAINPAIHLANTGIDNSQILENLLRISFLTKTIVRIPVIPGVNDNPDEIHNIAEFARLMSNVDTLHLLPYHSFGENKYGLLGRIYPMGEAESIAESKMELLKKEVESSGFHCHIGG
ncbi:glycyl-radical enzyme activating protein [Rahnella bonaserana]|jgi:pyruvate formate lyase activating enzyme|uniref:Glycyl-radical enzyme activating protein n=1 Tax=Rahnella bonaserana TaxID=2816248 RepID=A0ABS6LXE4_9GAMM|nr:glycyl-radical enzyme activating protein [Rahnella bonaserana]MBU9856689.1 glycyl-radical enzyme activating protein [Rahnella bonaserana]MCL9643736.1 glycyl-radical enzyme activating protein [Rahnella victoriana]